ncbi:WecB/TagA/CpsF family glycosyltransferase [Methylibium sp.]|uniref:WecB/TagA/CpsF family glycosyltransferase n=1 Tax=Methylibium sp. TaxID=2067992 RepID=UPI0025D77C21|nr:WecB/TagA/CpsF family glycosyltransferase [Methylibium sp.]
MQPDFNREVYCLLGLPFDALGQDAAVQRVQQAARERKPCFLSTPNLNFVIAAQTDAAFRNSVLHSDLSIVDGMPLVWVARLLGLPLRERVAGASVFERLRRSAGTPIKLFFFGGADGVARAACERLNAEPGALRCVGFDAPGFESVQAMSGEERIAKVNAAGADFVVVALGARKGQAWIEHNRSRLNAPVISHLGAVMNFVAGNVKRAPPWLQRGGLEWVWRIKEEPALWRRYGSDGLAFAALLVRRVLPLALQSLLRRPSGQQLASAKVSLEEGSQAAVLRLEGAWTAANLAPLRKAFTDAAGNRQPLRLDLSGVSHLDSAAIALMSLLWASRTGNPGDALLSGVQPRVRRQIELSCSTYLLAE